MTTALLQQREYPKDSKTGLTLPLSKSLGSQELLEHKATIAFELEVMAKKMDRFGWERDRGNKAHDRIVMDWMNVLCEFPLAEVQAACQKWVQQTPRKMPNEGDIRSLIMAAREKYVKSLTAPPEAPREERVSKEKADEILEKYGFSMKRFGR